MSSVERNGLLLLMMMTVMAAHVQVSHAAVYKIGESAGWTTIGNIDYKNWAATKNFKVGDTIIFEYNPKFHNVMRVTRGMYKSCNTSSTPLATFTTGNDSIKMSNHGHHYFLCGVPGHCQAGQKVDINVVRVSAKAPATSPILPPSNSNVPAPSPNKAAPFVDFKGAFCVIGLAMPFFALAGF